MLTLIIVWNNNIMVTYMHSVGDVENLFPVCFGYKYFKFTQQIIH